MGGKRTHPPRPQSPPAARGRETYASAQEPGVTCRPWAGNVRIRPDPSPHLPPVGGKRTGWAAPLRTPSAHGRETYASAQAPASRSCPWAGNVRGGLRLCVHLPPVGGKRTHPPSNPASPPARGREMYGVGCAFAYTFRPWAGSARIRPGPSVPIPPVGGKCTHPPRSQRPDPARGRETYASAQEPGVTSCPWAGNVRRRESEPRVRRRNRPAGPRAPPAPGAPQSAGRRRA